jgi:hypothetical protein
MGSILSCGAKGAGMSPGLQHKPNQIRDLATSCRPNPQALFTRPKHVQIARDYIGCATAFVNGQNDNGQDCYSDHAGNRTPKLQITQVH